MFSARIYSNDFNRIISASKAFVATSFHNKETLKLIRLEFNSKDSRVTAVACSGYMLSVEHAVITDCEESFIAYVNPSIRLPNKLFATFTLEENELLIRCDNYIFGFNQPKDKDYFDYDKAIPTNEPSFKIGFNANYLLTMLQAAKTSIGNVFKSPVVLEFTGNETMPVILRTNQDDIKMVLPVRLRD